MPLMSASQYAKHRGVSAARISQLKDRLTDAGCIDEYGLIISEKADEYLDSTLNRAKARNQVDSPEPIVVKRPRGASGNFCPTCGCPVSESDARAKKLWIESERQALGLKKDQESVVDADATRKAAFERGRSFRNAMLSIPARWGDELAAITDPFSFKQRLTRVLEEALTEEADRVE